MSHRMKTIKLRNCKKYKEARIKIKETKIKKDEH